MKQVMEAQANQGSHQPQFYPTNHHMLGYHLNFMGDPLPASPQLDLQEPFKSLPMVIAAEMGPFHLILEKAGLPLLPHQSITNVNSVEFHNSPAANSYSR